MSIALKNTTIFIQYFMVQIIVIFNVEFSNRWLKIISLLKSDKFTYVCYLEGLIDGAN